MIAMDSNHPDIRVTSLTAARRLKRHFDAVITIEDPGFRNGLRFHRKPHPDQIVLMFEDIDRDLRPRFACASPEQVAAGIEFGRDALDAGKSLLVHCRAGVSRSTAMFLAALSAHLGDGSEEACIRKLTEVRKEAVPNILVLRSADEYLGRGGRLFDAWMRYEHGKPRYAHYRSLMEETLEKSPGLYAKGLPEGMSGIQVMKASSSTPKPA